MSFSWQRAFLALAAIVLVLFGGYVGLFYVPAAADAQTYGVQFTPAHASHLGLDWRVAYTALLDDLRPTHLRLGAYWTDVEPSQDQFVFDDLDWMLNLAHERGASVVLAVGRRLPRWPECHVPAWAAALPEDAQRMRILTYAQRVVERYRAHPAVIAWQVENEPLLGFFGECPAVDRAFLEREVAFVRSLDAVRPILITDSGELSFWMRTAAIGDRLGTTMYRIVWNRFIGYWSYHNVIPPALYRVKAWLAGKERSAMFIAELQAEPWVPAGISTEQVAALHRQSIDALQFWQHVEFARATGFSPVYLWGAEYWYWLKVHGGDDSLWNAANVLFQERP